MRRDTRLTCVSARIDPPTLKKGIDALVKAYQISGSSNIAWAVVDYSETLVRHPEFDGTDAERCMYTQLALKWRWLAQSRVRPTIHG